MKTIFMIAMTGLAFFALATATQFDSPPPEKMIFVPINELNNPRPVYNPKEPAETVFPNVLFLPTCSSGGYFRDPYNCRKFYRCEGPNAVPYALYCQAGLIFSMETNWCDYPDRVKC